MAHTTNGEVLRRAVEAFVGVGTDPADELFTEDVSGWSPNMMVAGRAELVEAMADIDTALSNVTVHIDAVDGFANKAVAEYRLTCTFTGPLEAGDVTVAPNGHEIVLGAAIVADFEGSKIKAFRNYFDELTLLEQLLAPE